VIVHQPAIETFVIGHLSGSPVASAIAAMDDESCAAFARQVKTTLQGYAKGDGVVYPDEINIATALR